MSDQDAVQLSRTLNAGSEDDFDVVCEPCQTEGHRMQATGHCVDCNQNLCASCLQVHTKSPGLKENITKHDSTLSKFQTMQVQADKISCMKDTLTVKCSKHPEEVIKLFCHSHASLGCAVCIPLDHRQCKHISYIPEVSSNVEVDEKLRNVYSDLHMLTAKLASIKSRANWVKENLDYSYSKTIQDISNLKKEQIERLNQLEKELLDTASHLRDEQTQALETTLSECEALIQETEQMVSDLEGKKHKRNQLFVSLHKFMERLHSFAEEANILSSKTKNERISFEPEVNLAEVSTKLTRLGHVSLVRKSAASGVKYMHSMNVKSELATEDCVISGIVSLPDERLALVDHKNKLVNRVDATRRTIDASVMLDSFPLDLTYVDFGKLAVTLYKEKSILMLSVFPELSIVGDIPVNGFYWGIQHVPDKLILVCRDPVVAIHVTDMSGNLLQQIQYDYAGNPLFIKPSNIAVSPDQGTLYVTDLEQCALLLMTMDGKLIAKQRHDRMKDPFGVTIDDDGFVYVCSTDDQFVNQLSADGSQITVLLRKRIGSLLPRFAVYMAGKIYISCYANASEYRNNIKVYSLNN